MSGLHSSLPADLLCATASTVFPGVPTSEQPLHRISEVRRAQHLSIASIAKRLHKDIAEVRNAEQPQSDILLSELYQWGEVLDVPVEELLIEPSTLPANPVRNRGLLLRIMKTVRSILEETQETRTKHLAQTLNDQLIELMPELAEITPWPVVGHSREDKGLGAACLRRFEPGIALELEQ